jgi:TonB family protein
MSKKKVHNVAPEYPFSAKARGIQGTVLLHMVLDVDGKVEELQYISGPKELMKPAMDAVRQWRYSPTTLNGQPVEIETQVAVTYSLN